ncbi:hypothetical protein D512_28838 [Burkholderia pseudomallei MSHR1043]|nr:hypothetical protein D512_28838 [Burkholderia pseudomallei MSHR1043]
MRAGAGDFEQMSCLLRAVYLAYFMRNETAAGMDADGAVTLAGVVA